MKRLFATTAMLLALNACGFEIVDTGNRGVEVKLGEVVGEPLPEGIHFYNPVTSNIIEMSIQTNMWNVDSLAYTKDVQQAKISFSVNYNLDPTAVLTTYKTIGTGWEDKLVAQAVPAIMKNVIGRYEAVQLVAERNKATAAIEAELMETLGKQGVIVSRFEITNIDYDDAFEKAVEAKVVAVQNAEAAVNKTKQVKEEATQTEITATAFANGMKIKSDALAQNQSLVAYEAVQKWDGKLPVTIMGGDIKPLLNMALPKAN
jgi:regulator of protease activity HflC (stomatin/prohibitin superfamily)